MQNFEICCLYSGSRGNCTFIRAGGASILIDAGKSARALCTALKQIGVEIDSIDAIFITHEHNDHISALRTLSHKHSIPIHMLLGSALIFRHSQDEKLCNNLVIYNGREFETDVKGLHVKAFPTPHDSQAAVGYRLSFKDEDGQEIAIACSTDTGCVTEAMRENLKGCHAVVMESNHDVEMLMCGPYPYDLKRRIRSKEGHLSNADCAAFACELCESGTEHIMLAHLSEENNLPTLAYNEVYGAIGREGFDLKVAKQDEAVWLIKQA